MVALVSGVTLCHSALPQLAGEEEEEPLKEAFICTQGEVTPWDSSMSRAQLSSARLQDRRHQWSRGHSSSTGVDPSVAFSPNPLLLSSLCR